MTSLKVRAKKGYKWRLLIFDKIERMQHQNESTKWYSNLQGKYDSKYVLYETNSIQEERKR